MERFVISRLISICLIVFVLEGNIPIAATSTADSRDDETITLTSFSVTAAFDGEFYVESPDRAFGIKVCSAQQVYPGDTVTVTGILKTRDGERCVENAVISDVINGAGLAKSVVLRLDQVGGGDLDHNPGIPGRFSLYNIGLLIRTTGIITSVDTHGFEMANSEGSLRVESNGQAYPVVGTPVVVKGISSVFQEGSSVRPKIRATAVSVRPNWNPRSIVFIGDSLTAGVFASSYNERGFKTALMNKLQAAYPGETFTSAVVSGFSGGNIAGMRVNAKAYSGPWPDIVVFQDAATQQNPFTGGSTNAEGTVTVSNGQVTGLNIATAGTGYKAWSEAILTTGENRTACIYITEVDAGGGIKTFSIPNSGFNYTQGQTVQICQLSWINIAKEIVDDILTRWHNPGSPPPLILFCNCWLQPGTAFVYNGKNASWNTHVYDFCTSDEYRTKLIPVDIDSISSIPGCRGWTEGLTGSVEAGGTQWTLNKTPSYDIAAFGHYLVRGGIGGTGSRVISQAGNVVTVADPSPTAVSKESIYFAEKIISPCCVYGDLYHPTNAGHAAIADKLFETIQKIIQDGKP